MNAKYKMPSAIVGHIWLSEKNCEEFSLNIINIHYLEEKAKTTYFLAPNDDCQKARACMMELGRTPLTIT